MSQSRRPPMSALLEAVIPARIKTEANEEYVSYLIDPPSLGSMAVSMLGAAFLFGSGVLLMFLPFQSGQNATYQVTSLAGVALAILGSWQLRALVAHSQSGHVSITLTKSLLIVRCNGWQGVRGFTWHRDEISMISSAFVFDIVP